MTEKDQGQVESLKGDVIEAWRGAILPSGSSIQKAILNLNTTAMRIVLVIDSQGGFVGTISDGDIRRGLLKNLDLEDVVDDIVNSRPLVVAPGIEGEIVRQLMITNKVQQIPIVDNKGQLMGLHLWDEVMAPQARSNSMVIMAGGKGVRLLPHTENCPKPMVIVSGKPMLEHIIERGKIEGFSNFVLAIHHLGHMIEDYFGNGERFGVRIEYLREESALGTAGALSLFESLPSKPIVVTNGDVITDIRYGELLDFHESHKAAATMAVRVHEWQNPFGVVCTQGVEIVGFEEKPITKSHINAGVYVLSPNALTELIRDEHCDMPTLFERLHDKSHRTVAYPVLERWLDVGRPDDLAQASRESEKSDDK